MMTYEEFRDSWATKTVKQIEKEIESWRKYMQKHRKAYAWHGAGMTAPGALADGDKLSALRDALEIAQNRTGKKSLQVATPSPTSSGGAQS